MERINAAMVAPCGMNCALCIAHQRKEIKRERHCDGCNDPQVSACARCVIRRCDKRAETQTDFCYECAKFPCKRLQQLDARYQKNYATSLLDNLAAIRQHGPQAFAEQETERWACPHCGSLLCIHRGFCPSCKAKR